MKKYIYYPWYPFLLAAYPVLALFSHNLGQVKSTVMIQPLVLSVLTSLLLFLLFRVIYRRWHRAAFIVLVWIILFYSYGQIYDQIWARWKSAHLGTWLVGLWVALAILALILAGLRRVAFEKAAPALNVFCLILLLYPASLALDWSILSQRHSPAKNAPLEILHAPPGQTPPDIYYFILDSYGSASLLQQAYGYDNTPFIQSLQNSGFYVASCSQSNYVRTEISVGSSLNMQYLQDLDPALTAKNLDQAPIWGDMRYNAVSLDLKTAGYKTVAFATGFAWSEFDNSDVFIASPPSLLKLNEFDTLLLSSTALRPLDGPNLLDLAQIAGERDRERTQLIFNSMDRLAAMPGPKFVFIHVIAPHPPFVFGPDGSTVDPGLFLNAAGQYTADKYAQGYQNMVTFLNKKVESAVATLITKSATPPVIILQGDHGPWLQTGSDSFRILNAYYLPGHEDRLYPTISPVNTFRLILDSYLGADYPLLQDITYYSPIPNIYQFTPVPNPCKVP